MWIVTNIRVEGTKISHLVHSTIPVHAYKQSPINVICVPTFRDEILATLVKVVAENVTIISVVQNYHLRSVVVVTDKVLYEYALTT